MSERSARIPTHRSKLPTVQIITGGYARLPVGPLALYEITLIAGDAEDAVMTLRVRMDEDPLICLVACASGTASFVPAAPTVILDALHICILGSEAAGSVTYR